MVTDEDELLAHCAEHLAAFKLPKRIVLVRSIARSPGDKVLRRVLVEQYAAMLSDGVTS